MDQNSEGGSDAECSKTEEAWTVSLERGNPPTDGSS